MSNSFKNSALAAIILSAGLSMPALSAARAVSSSDVAMHSGVDEFSAARRGGGGARVHAGGGGRANVNVNRRANVNVNRRTNVNVNAVRRTNVNVVGRRPVRVWAHRPYYGTIVGGVAIGTIIAATAAGVAPAAPASNMCWYWADAAQVQGYWDYCVAP